MIDRGVAGLAALVLTGAAALIGLALFAGTQLLVAQAQAANAADAAALAAAPVTFRPFGSSGRPWEEAERFAAANGARLIRCRCVIDRSLRRRMVEVEVVVVRPVPPLSSRLVRATGRAEFDPSRVIEGVSDIEQRRGR